MKRDRKIPAGITEKKLLSGQAKNGVGVVKLIEYSFDKKSKGIGL
jgi:hypothetical protein